MLVLPLTVHGSRSGTLVFYYRTRHHFTEVEVGIASALANLAAAAIGSAELYDELRAMREACGEAHMKAILATGDLATLRNVYKASLVAMMAGADFIKTSTGKEEVNATLPVGLIMLRALREYQDETGARVGFKAAGGLRSAKDALTWLSLMKEEVGEPWLLPDLFRIGASTLLGDIERQIEHFATGRYSAANRHAAG